MEDTVYRALHDRATRGESLTAQESRYLEEWYARMDSAEEALLSRMRGNLAKSTDPDINGLLSWIRAVTKLIAALSKQNNALRSEIADLYRILPR